MLALAICSIAIAYYVSPTIVRRCCRQNNKPVSAELIDEYRDL